MMSLTRSTARALGAAALLASAPVAAQRVAAADDRSAATARALDELLARPVTIDARGVSRRAALAMAAGSARVTVQYQDQLLDAYADRVTVRVKGVPLRDALERIFAGTTLWVVPDGPGELAVIERGSRQGQPTRGSVAGRVVDSASGRGLRGATIRVEGMKLSGVVGDDGRFTIRDVPAGDRTLTVRLFGYRPVVRDVRIGEGEPITVTIAMASVPTTLTDVVTTATGQQRRVEVGSDITVLNVDSLRQVAPIHSVTDLLESRVPGLVVMRTSGLPGAPSRIRLRGATSLTRSNDPIVVVDGIRVYADQASSNAVGRKGDYGPVVTYATPSPLDQIDPNSIETIEVLKGPSASAMYGSDAGNGVIVITTKRGRSGPTRWTLALDDGFSFTPGAYPVGTYRFGHHYDEGEQACYLMDVRCTLDNVVKFQAMNDPRYSVLAAHGIDRQASTAVSGGAGALTYALTGTLGRQTGQLKLPDIEVERFRKFHNFDPPGWMARPDHYTTAGGSSALTLPVGAGNTSGGRQGTVQLQSSLFKSAQQQSSLQTAIGRLQGLYVDTTRLDQQPLVPEFYERSTSDRLTFNNALAVNWPVFAWLPLTATAGVNVTTGTDEALTPRDYAPGADSLGHFGVQNRSATTGTFNVTSQLPSRWVTTAVGYNWMSQSERSLASQVKGLAIGVNRPTDFGELIPGQNNGSSTQQSTGSTTYGWFVQPQLNFHSRFFASPGLRLDGGSASGTRVSAGGIPGVSGFPKLDLSWLAIDQNRGGAGAGNAALRAVSLLRLRGGLGTAGVQPAPGDQLRLFAPKYVTINGVPRDVTLLQTLGNTRLRPERSRELEYGFDLELWRSRASVTLTGFQKRREDAIIPGPVAPSVMQTEMARNLGLVRSSGLEATASAQLLESAALGWHVGATMSRQSDLLVRLAPEQQEIANALNPTVVDGITTRFAVGYPLNGIWVKPILGYGDRNQDGIIEPDEVLIGAEPRYVGRSSPNYELGLNTDLTLLHGRLGVHTQVAYQNGMTQFNTALTRTSNVYVQGGSRLLNSGAVLFANDPSVSLEQQAAFAAYLGSSVHYQTSDDGTAYGLLQTVNALRWQSLSINYDAPLRVARLLRAQRLSLALQGSNLGLHTNYRGKDPNVNAFTSGEQVTDAGQVPLPRTFRVAITVGN